MKRHGSLVASNYRSRITLSGNFVVIGLLDSIAKQVPSKNHVDLLSFNRLGVSDLLSVKRFRLTQNTH